MTRDAKDKAAARYQFTVGFTARAALRAIIIGPFGPCPLCKVGPLQVADPRRIEHYNVLWRQLDLDSFEGVATEAQVARIQAIDLGMLPEDAPAPTAAELAALAQVHLDLDVQQLRFLHEIVATRAGLNAVAPIVLRDLWLDMLRAADANGVRLTAKDEAGKYEDDPTEDDGDERSIVLSPADRLAIVEAMRSPTTCQHVFEFPGGKLFHGVPSDGPRTHRALSDFCGVYEALDLAAIDHPTAEVRAAAAKDKEGTGYAVTLAEVKYLADLVARRCSNIVRGPQRLGPVIAILEAVRAGGGKPVPPVPEKPQEPPEATA